ncbi:MAG: ABC transporter permease [Sandaracinaceae bacterium]|nr:ABC transporter permease [Sandaracinaceae bacterium]
MVRSGEARTPQSRPFRVIAIFRAGFQEYDSRLVYADLFEVQAFLGQGDSVTGVEMRLNDLEQSVDVARRLERVMEGPFHTMDWAELNRPLFTALELQKIMLSLVIATIIWVAAFNVIATLIAIVIEKKREIAILKAMGASDGTVLAVFMVQGTVIGLVGTLAGPALGGAIVGYLSTFRFALDPRVYLIDHLPGDHGERVRADGGHRALHLHAEHAGPQLVGGAHAPRRRAETRMTSAVLPYARTTRPRAALTLVLVSATLLGCDPVDETAAEEHPAPAEPSREDRRASDESARGRARGVAEQGRAAREEAAADTIAAEVAAGLVDAGPLAALEAEPEAPAEAAGGAPGSADVYVRPVIHPDVIPNFRVLRFSLAEDVVDREPVMVSSSFRRDSGPMHVFLEVRNETGEDIQLFVGFRPASVTQRGGGVSLTIPPSPRYRTRARSNTRRAVGEWVCEIGRASTRAGHPALLDHPGAEPSPAAEPGAE